MDKDQEWPDSTPFVYLHIMISWDEIQYVYVYRNVHKVYHVCLCFFLNYFERDLIHHFGHNESSFYEQAVIKTPKSKTRKPFCWVFGDLSFLEWYFIRTNQPGLQGIMARKLCWHWTFDWTDVVGEKCSYVETVVEKPVPPATWHAIEVAEDGGVFDACSLKLYSNSNQQTSD